MSVSITIGLLGEEPQKEHGMGLLDGGDCPEATQDVELNLKNRQKAIKVANYGPLNPNDPNTDFWKQKAKIWSISTNEAKNSRCGNCAAFNQSENIKSCIEEGLGGTEDDWDVIEAGDLGYCEMFDFKCASARTCDAWIVKED